MGNSRVPMIVSIIMNLLNVAGNVIGIFVFHGGVIGIAIAAVIMMYLSLNRKNEIFIRFSEIFSWNGSMIKKVLNIAIPNGIENGIVQLGRVLLVSIIALFGTAQIAANGITNSLVMISISFASAMNLAIVTVVGQCVGAAGDVRFTMIISISSMFIFRIALGHILGVVFSMGVIGIWIAMGFDWALRSIIYIARFKSGKWKNFQVI